MFAVTRRTLDKAALLVPPYTWPITLVSSTDVFTVNGKFRVHAMMGNGMVRISNGRQIMNAPKQMGFVDCPSCNAPHKKLTRRCTVCSESMVYFPQPRKSAATQLLVAERKRQKAEKLSLSRHRIAGTPQVLSAVRSTCAHYLHQLYDFNSAEELVAVEAKVRDRIEHNVNKDKPNPNQTARYLATFERRVRDNPDATIEKFKFLECLRQRDRSIPQEQILLGFVLALCADAGLVKNAHDFVRRQGLLIPVDAVTQTKYLKDSFINDFYIGQTVVKAVSVSDFKNLQ
eukprot:TRINITY_DN14281_c0_g1_i5.p1 TRINITY_DN14281_c0_g1~~TRINITY_DN14281_c0_g1_i5.p1  ORF type:complete len:287 (+),score=12.46 TRINITY_DN14281_c0_g1_i5:138-998(+)